MIRTYQETGMQVKGKIREGNCMMSETCSANVDKWKKKQQHWFKKINKREKKRQILWLVGITVSEVLVMAKITCNGTN